MPFSAGVFNRLYSWAAQRDLGVGIGPNPPTQMDADGDDVAAGLSAAILRDGTGRPTVDIPFGGRTITNMRPAIAGGEAAEFNQVNLSVKPFNLLHNASFLIDQRGVGYGTVGLGSNVYGHDRWKSAVGTGCGYSVSLLGNDYFITITVGTMRQIVDFNSIEAAQYTLYHEGTAPCRAYQVAVPAFGSPPFTTPVLTAAVDLVCEFGPGTVIRPRLVLGSSPKGFARRTFSEEIEICRAFYETTPLVSLQNYPVVGHFVWPFIYRVEKLRFAKQGGATIAYAQLTGFGGTPGNGYTVTVVNSTKYGCSFDQNIPTATSSNFVAQVTCSCEP